MRNAIENFAKQFEYVPEVVHEDALVRSNNIVLAGMGGSHLAADILKAACPELNLIVQSDYGLFEFTDSEALYIASSYSGNTEETIDFLEKAYEKKLPILVIATGGTLIDFAREHTLPYIVLPHTGIQPRSALGFSLRALAYVLKTKDVFNELGNLSSTLDAAQWENQGKELATQFKGKVPVIYASTQNAAVAYNWKIKCNETGKIPAFYNVFPELNHNEMNGFDVSESTKALSEHIGFIFLADDTEHERIQKRMHVTKEQYEERGLRVVEIPFSGEDRFLRICNSLLLADWFALFSAELYGAEAEQVPMIEDFKKRITA